MAPAFSGRARAVDYGIDTAAFAAGFPGSKEVNMERGRRFALPLVALMSASVLASPPDREALLRRPQYESISISPDGEYFAARMPLEDRTVLAILRASDMAVTATVDPGSEGFIDDSLWVGPSRLFASSSKRFGGVAQPYDLGYLYSIDADGRHRRGFEGTVVDPLAADQDRVLVSECVRVVKQQCLTRLREVATTGRGKGRDIVDGPVAGAEFLVDRHGSPKLSWAWDLDDRQQVFLRRDDAWIPLNDEDQTHVEVLPLGISHDGRHGFLWTERSQGPDVIERIELASGARSVIASDPASSPVSLVWSFDQRDLIGVRYGSAQPRIRFLDEGHPHVALMRELEAAFPGEVATVTSATEDGRKAVVRVSGDREPGRYYVLDVATGDLRLLARSRPWLQDASLAAMQPFEMHARDGVGLGGYLTRPSAGEGPHPLVVLPHGGPFGVADRWGFDEEVQMLAADGYAVLQVNFRGSAGRGREFTEQGYREWGGLMQDDLEDAVAWARSQDGIDGTRTCIWGASYGAYAALMAVARDSAHYRCAIGMAGPYDLPTLYKWGSTQRSRWGKAWLEKSLGTDMALLVQRSPTHLAKRIDTPVLLVQGGRDRLVSSEHFKSMQGALEKAGKTYEAYSSPGETHGFFADKSRNEYYRRVMDFLSRYLKTKQTSQRNAIPVDARKAVPSPQAVVMSSRRDREEPGSGSAGFR